MSDYQRLTPEIVEASLTDLDYAIFAALPEYGQKLGYHPLFKSVKHLRGELNKGIPKEAQLSAGVLGSRLRSLAVGGLTRPVNVGFAVGRIDGWQRTSRATQLLNSRNEGATSND